MPDWFWYVVSPLVIGGYFYFQWTQKRKTKNRYEKLAKKRGWQYDASDSSLARKYRGEPFDWGRWDKAQHVFRGPWRKRQIEVFEYSAAIKENDRAGDEVTRRRQFQVVSLKIPGDFPEVHVEQRGVVGKISQKLGGGGLQTGDERFDAKYAVTTSHPEFASAILTDDMRSWLLSTNQLENNPIRLVGDAILTWRPGPLELGDIEPRLQLLSTFLDHAAPGGR
ncbi:hypothetical protein BJF85_07405 [Saccharomonospora sp. CUA-673]|uniref:hypothetical protein n=1 Tax=Saccharomonospora sp. CUA-673 TaxID=1904969 RepID=UPI00095CE6A6|nr:hypothetical protein [Saccharomonospora sp. CUA-673]OLT39038.1 hypothetical protein BJF85_07405 [Saccharomonospora sp. CUA-673]